MMYSSDSMRPIVSTTLIETIKESPNKRFVWDPTNSEHFVQLELLNNDKLTIYYPSLRSLKERINFASKNHLSLSIWDIGQGFNYFFDLL
jgi:chitinase domain-containing protein 1